jgi:phosphonoacetaldehyde hydrolase
MYRYSRIYTGKLKTLVGDWSGTFIDPYVVAPAVVFCEVFKKFKVPISMREARVPMGLRKDLHIKAILENPDVKDRWYKQYKRNPCSRDVDEMFKEFVPLQVKVLPKYCEILPYTYEFANIVRNEFDMKIGITTGFTSPMVNVILNEVKKQGFVPDSSVAGDEVNNGARPTPSMIWKNLDILGTMDIKSVLKIGDTVGDIGEGLNAGCWTCGLSKYSNYMDIDNSKHACSLSIKELEEREEHTREILLKAGAHYVVKDLSDIPQIISHINWKLSCGYFP